MGIGNPVHENEKFLKTEAAKNDVDSYTVMTVYWYKCLITDPSAGAETAQSTITYMSILRITYRTL